jgi:hypothetical protein
LLFELNESNINKEADMIKSRKQMVLEAKLRAMQIAEKSKKIQARAENVPTSWGQVTNEFMSDVGFFYSKKSHVGKKALIEKRLSKNVIEIDIRKKAV